MLKGGWFFCLALVLKWETRWALFQIGPKHCNLLLWFFSINVFSTGLKCAPNIYSGTRPTILPLSLCCFSWFKLLNSKLFKTPATENYFLHPDEHFLTAGLLNSSYYFCVLCYKQCRWYSLVIFLHQSSFRFVCCFVF